MKTIMRTINILGTEYSMEIHKMSEDAYLKENSLSGYCSKYRRKIVIADMDEAPCFKWSSETEKDVYTKEVIRHEIIHAFLSESGLADSSGSVNSWATNEEMVDWIACQFHKISEVYKILGV